MERLTIREYTPEDIPQLTLIWNEIVEGAVSFPEEAPLTLEEAEKMFASQTATICVCRGKEIVGFYVLHPNGIGRRSHICNCSYGVKKEARGNHIGRLMVLDSFQRSREHGFKVLQYNGVVSVNEAALRLYREVGMIEAGIIQNGYRLKDGSYADGIMFTKQL